MARALELELDQREALLAELVRRTMSPQGGTVDSRDEQ